MRPSSGLGRRVGTDDSDQLVRQVRCGRNGVVNALRRSRVISTVLRAGNDSLVRLALLMQALEISMIMGKHSAQIGDGIGENLRVINALVGSARLLNGPHIVAEPAQLLDARQRQIPIPIESRPRAYSSPFSP